MHCSSDIWLLILQFLTCKELIILSFCNQFFRSLCDTYSLWETRAKEIPEDLMMFIVINTGNNIDKQTVPREIKYLLIRKSLLSNRFKCFHYLDTGKENINACYMCENSTIEYSEILDDLY